MKKFLRDTLIFIVLWIIACLIFRNDTMTKFFTSLFSTIIAIDFWVRIIIYVIKQIKKEKENPKEYYPSADHEKKQEEKTDVKKREQDFWFWWWYLGDDDQHRGPHSH